MSDGQPVYNVNDGVFGRDGGPYGDQVDARAAERQRALVENREPETDPTKVPAFVGQQLVTKPQLLASYNSTLLAGDDRRPFEGEVTALEYADVPKYTVAQDAVEVASVDSTVPVVEGVSPEEVSDENEDKGESVGEDPDSGFVLPEHK